MGTKKRKAGRIIGWSLGGIFGVVLLLLLLVYLLRIPILLRVLDRYNESIPGEILFEPADVLPLKSLPMAEIYLQDVIVLSPSDSTGMAGKVLLEIEDVRAVVDLRELFRGDLKIPLISLKKGLLACQEGIHPGSGIQEALGISLSGDSEDKDDTGKKKREIGLDSIYLEDLAICWSETANDLHLDMDLDQLFGSFSSHPDTLLASIEFMVDINNFKYQKYRLKDEENIIFSGSVFMDQAEEKIEIDSSTLSISGLDLNTGGYLYYGEDRMVDLAFEARNQGIEVLNYLLFGILDMDEIEQTGTGQLQLRGTLRGSYKDQLPVLEMEGVADRLSFLVRPVDKELSDISFRFYSTNGRYKDLRDAEIRVEEFSATLPEGKIGGTFYLANKLAPEVDVELHGELELAGLEHVLSLDSIRKLEGKLRLDGQINGVFDEGSGNFLNDAGELSAFVTDLGFIAGSDTLKDVNGELFINGNLIGARDMSLYFNGNKLNVEAEVEDIVLYLLGFEKDINAHLGIASDLILPGRITQDTAIAGVIGDELKSLVFGASALIGHRELDALLQGDSLPEVQFKLDSFGIQLPGFADISHLNAGVTLDYDTLKLHYLDGIIGESAFSFSGDVKGYRALIDQDSGDISLGFKINSPQMRARDFFTWGGNFILPDQYEGEFLENFSIAGSFSLPAEGIVHDSLPLDFNGRIGELEWRFRDYPMTFEKFLIEARKQGDVLYLDEFRGNIGDSDIRMQAEIHNIGDSLIENMTGQLAVESSLLDLNELLNFQLPESFEDSLASDSLSDGIAPGLPQISYPDFFFDLNIGKLVFENYVIKGISGALRSTKEKVFYADQFRISSESGGLLEFTGQFNAVNPENFNFNAQVDLTDVNLHDLDFEMQSGEEVYNLKENFAGIVSGTGMAEVYFTPELKLDIPRSTALFHVEVKEGELINFTPLKAAGKYLDNKDLDHVRFSTLRNSFTLIDSKIIVPLMIVESTLGQLLIEGEQGLDKSYLYLLYIPMELVRDAAKSVMTSEEEEGEEDEIQRMQMQKVMMLTPWSDGVESGVRVGDKRDRYRK